MKILLILLTLLLSAGCTQEKTITFSFSAPEAEKIAVKKLKEQNIWFRKAAGGRYEFLASDVKRVQEIYRDASNLIIPEGRSSSYGPEMFKIMEKLLNKEKVPYQVRQYQGSNWIVWEESDSKRIQEIQKLAENELMVMLNENNK